MILTDNIDSILGVNDLSELIMTYINGKNLVIEKNIYDDYDAFVNKMGTTYILAVTLKGSLVLFEVMNDCKIKKHIILDNKNNQKNICSVRLMRIEGHFHAFYCIFYNSKAMIVHHIINVETPTIEPRVIDYISTKCIYDVCVDNDNNINLFYVDEDEQIKYTRYKYSQKNYEKIKINYSSDVRAISCVCTADSTFAAFLTKKSEYNVIECLDTTTDKTAIAGFGVDKISRPCLITDGKSLGVQWCERDYGFESIADDMFVFSKPHMLASDCKEVLVRISGNEKHMFINMSLSGLKKRLFGLAKKISSDFDSLSLDASKCNIEEDFVKDNIQYKIYLIEQKISDLKCKFDILSKQVIKLMSSPESANGELSDVGEIDEENLKKFENFNFDNKNNDLEDNSNEQ